MANSLFETLGIDGYVPKTRGAATDFRTAINAIYQDKQYHSPNLKQDIKTPNNYEFTELEKTIVSLISEGYTQKEIASYLELNQFKPSSLSSIEKCLNHLKTVLNISSNGQLIAYCKDKKVI